MSTTSCPRCSAQVTLPVGVSNETKVRCPLCHAHYTLADALVNMPPLLEVVDVESESLASDWYDEPNETKADAPLAAAVLPDDDGSEADTLELGSLELEGLELDAEIDDVDATTTGKETVIDEFSASTLETSAAPTAEPEDEDELLAFDAPEAEALADAEDVEELSLDFGGESLTAEEAGAETLEFGSDQIEAFGEEADTELKFDLAAAEEPGEAMTLDFGAPVEDESPVFTGDEEVKFDLSEPSDEQAETIQFTSPDEGEDRTIEFNFDADANDVTVDSGLREFEDHRVEATGDADDLPLELTDAPVALPMAEAVEEEPVGKKGKKKDKKKEKPAKVVLADGEKPKRSLVGSLVSVLLPAIVAVPLALYGALWISKDYDFLGLGGFLPSAVLPAEYSKKPTQLAQYTPPATPAPITSAPEPAEESPAAETPAEEEAPAETPAENAATPHVAGRPTEDAATPPAEEMPAEAAPAEQPAGEAPSLTPPAEEAAATPAEVPAAEPADPFAPAAEEKPAEEMPAEATPADDKPVGDDLFAPATEPAAESTPAPPADAPAESDPFAPAPERAAAPAETTPPADAPAAAEADPFAPAPAEKPAEMPAESDPFAPTPAEKPAAEPALADPFAPAPEEKTPAEKPADAPADAPVESDPFAPAPAEKPAEAPADAPITTPAEPDPFAPAPAEKPPEKPADRPAEPDPFAPEPKLPEATPAPAPDAPPAEADPLAPAPVEPAPKETLPEPPAEAAAPTEPLGPRNVAAVSSDDVSGAMQATFVAGQQLIAAEAGGNEAELRKARAAFYVNLFGMADTITSAKLGEGAAQLDPQFEAIGPTIKQQLAADPRRLEALKVFGARWIGFPKRTTNGVVVSGTVESAEQVGKLFHTKARLGSSSDAPLVTIITAEQPEVAAGDTVLALGSIVENPAQQIAGYEGTDPSVVWSGMTMKVTPAGN